MPKDSTSLTALRRAVPEPEKPSGREPMVRMTVDLPETSHYKLKLFAMESGVSMSDVLRAMVKMLDEDAGLAATVRRRAGG